MFRYGFCLMVSVIALTSFAEEEKKAFQAELEVGIITTSGNTNTESYKGKFDAKHDLGNWRNHYLLEGLLSRDELEDDEGEKSDQTTAEKYFASIKADRKLHGEHAALFIYGSYDKNRFSGFDYQYTIAAGYTNRLFSRDNAYLLYDIGPGVTVNKSEETGDETDTVIIRALLEFFYQISSNAKFTQTVSSDYAPDTDENSKTKSVTALTADINSSFSLRASYTVDHNSRPPEGNEHADTQTSITLVYSF